MPLSVLLVDGDPNRASELGEILAERGYAVVGRVEDMARLVDEVTRLKPDVIVVDIELPDRDTLEQMSLVTRDQPKPIVMFVADGDPAGIEPAIRAGVTAYVVDGIEAHRVRAILDVAVAQFRAFQDLRRERDEAKATLAERKLIERAKGLIMRQRGCDEAEAYAEMRRMAMNQSIRLVDLAERIISVAQLLTP